jgi:hypothetical protein
MKRALKWALAGVVVVVGLIVAIGVGPSHVTPNTSHDDHSIANF